MRSTGQWMMRWCVWARILKGWSKRSWSYFYTHHQDVLLLGVWTPVASSVNALRSSFHTLLFFIFPIFFLFRKNYISLSSLCRIFNDICVRCKCIKSAYKLICSVNTSIVSACSALSAQMQWKSSFDYCSIESEARMKRKIHGKLFERPILSESENGLNDKKLSEPMGDRIRSKFESNKKPLKMRYACHASKFGIVSLSGTRVLNIITQQMKLNYWNGDDNLDNNMLWLNCMHCGQIHNGRVELNRIGCVCVSCVCFGMFSLITTSEREKRTVYQIKTLTHCLPHRPNENWNYYQRKQHFILSLSSTTRTRCAFALLVRLPVRTRPARCAAVALVKGACRHNFIYFFFRVNLQKFIYTFLFFLPIYFVSALWTILELFETSLLLSCFLVHRKWRRKNWFDEEVKKQKKRFMKFLILLLLVLLFLLVSLFLSFFLLIWKTILRKKPTRRVHCYPLYTMQGCLPACLPACERVYLYTFFFLFDLLLCLLPFLVFIIFDFNFKVSNEHTEQHSNELQIGFRLWCFFGSKNISFLFILYNTFYSYLRFHYRNSNK